MARRKRSRARRTVRRARKSYRRAGKAANKMIVNEIVDGAGYAAAEKFVVAPLAQRIPFNAPTSLKHAGTAWLLSKFVPGARLKRIFRNGINIESYTMAANAMSGMSLGAGAGSSGNLW